MAEEDVKTIRTEAEAAEEMPEMAAPHLAAHVEAPALKSSFSAIASADVVDLDTTASAVGLAQVSGDAHVTASYVGIMTAKQGGSIQQSYASAVIMGGDTAIRQAGAPLIIGRTMNIEQGGGGVLVGSDVKAKNSVIGVVISGRSEISEDSKVIIGTKAAVIIAAAILGGFAVVAVVMAMGTKRIADWGRGIKKPELPSRNEMQAWAHDLQSRIQALRKSA